MNGSRNQTQYNGQIAKLTCRQCGRPSCVVLNDFTLLGHGPGTGCRGPREGVFEDLLHTGGLCAGPWRCRFPEAA